MSLSLPTPEAAFSELHSHLLRLAYRMLGSVADAEDVVQDAYARWLAADRQVVRKPAAFLRTMVTRLCLNELKSARRRRQAYIGPWLPEPIFDPEGSHACEEITLPLMIALERLSPLERAAFLLHDVFGVEFEAVGEAIGRTAATCRKLASRARARLQAARPRFPVGKEEGVKLAAAFFEASRTGDISTLRSLLAEGVVAYADGGGKVPATLHPLEGLEAVLARHAAMAEEFAISSSQLLRYAWIDGLPGFVTIESGNIAQTTALQIERGKIAAIYVIRNPDKLRRLSLTATP